jgi:hypothetical protein
LRRLEALRQGPPDNPSRRATVSRVRPNLWLIPALILATAGIAAASEPEHPPDTAEPNTVYVRAFLVDVDDISSVEQNFSASVYLEFRWHDPALAHDGAHAITIPRSHAAYPPFKIVNSQRVMDSFGDKVEVSPDGELRLRRRVWGRFSQILDLGDFPFDQQTFGIHIAAVTPGTLRFVAEPGPPSGISKRLSVADWEISGFAARAHEYEPFPGERALPGFLISFDGERRVSHYVVKVIVPLVLIVAMAGLVFWIDPKQATSQISVSVTTMLTLIAYRFAIGSELPKLHYLTRMDEFLLGSTVLVFSCLVTVVITSGLANRDQLDSARRIDRWARRVFPLSFLIVSLWAFVF